MKPVARGRSVLARSCQPRRLLVGRLTMAYQTFASTTRPIFVPSSIGDQGDSLSDGDDSSSAGAAMLKHSAAEYSPMNLSASCDGLAGVQLRSQVQSEVRPQHL